MEYQSLTNEFINIQKYNSDENCIELKNKLEIKTQQSDNIKSDYK